MTNLETIINHLEHHVSLEEWNIEEFSTCVIGHTRQCFGKSRGQMESFEFLGIEPEKRSPLWNDLVTGRRADFPNPESAAAYMRKHFLPQPLESTVLQEAEEILQQYEVQREVFA